MEYMSVIITVLTVPLHCIPNYNGSNVSHRSLCQGRDDVAQSRQRLVDVLSFIQDRSCSTSLTDLEKGERMRDNMNSKKKKKDCISAIQK